MRRETSPVRERWCCSFRHAECGAALTGLWVDANALRRGSEPRTSSYGSSSHGGNEETEGGNVTRLVAASEWLESKSPSRGTFLLGPMRLLGLISMSGLRGVRLYLAP
ncbi:hypothetical protein EYF80_006353 [Liparis tanakae]|uniref:Uncharacterized protein n=1 Tax=Liparis tanakae TaxID=230148 RepID=A0A4Z2J1I2_9TELE|nr:hypothetical protein EYF80_006353 [Liparis tanakae]